MIGGALLMPAEFIVNRGNESKIKEQMIIDGSLWLSEDGQNIYLDSDKTNTRIHITDVIDLSVENPTKYYPNKLYIDGVKIKAYDVQSDSLKIISNLESEVLESQNEFIYDSEKPNVATLSDTSLPIKGTHIIDKNGDVGVVLNSTERNVTVIVLSNNKYKNILSNYELYIDTTYDGIQVGTFDCPYNNWLELYNSRHNILTNYSTVTIYLKSNSEIKITEEMNDLRNIIFKGIGSKILVHTGVHFKNCNNIIFKNVTLNHYSDLEENPSTNISFNNCNNIKFLDNEDICNLIFEQTTNITFEGITAISNKYTLDINASKNINIYNCKAFSDVSIKDFEEVINISDSELNSLLAYSNESINLGVIRLNNTTFINGELNVYAIREISLNGGCIRPNDNSKVIINSNFIYLGTFNFNGVSSEINGSIIETSGLSSKQVYDIKNRTYNNENLYLESHLDAIDNSMIDIRKNFLIIRY